MTQYVDLLTETVFKAIKDGMPEQFEADFREAFIKAANKEYLDRGQRSSFRPTVRRQVMRRVASYQARCPQLPLHMAPPTITISSNTAPTPPMDKTAAQAKLKILRDKLVARPIFQS